MRKKTPLLLWILVFLVLNLYVNLSPRLLRQDHISHWLIYWFTFFGLAFVAARYVLRLRGLQSFGMHPHEGWFQNMAIGFLVGFGIYALKYMICYGLGMFAVAGTMDGSFITILVAQALLAMFFSSAINDVMIRGYALAFLRKNSC